MAALDGFWRQFGRQCPDAGTISHMCITGISAGDSCGTEVLLSLRHRGFLRRGDGPCPQLSELLQCAISNGQLAATHLLLRWGADVSALDLPELFDPAGNPPHAFQRNASALLQLILRHAGPGILAERRRQGDELLERLLLDDKRGIHTTPYGREKARLARVLLQNGASPHQCDSQGVTLLQRAVFLCRNSHSADLVLDFLRAGADVSANNFCALRESVRHQNWQSLEVLLLHGGRAFFSPPPPSSCRTPGYATVSPMKRLQDLFRTADSRPEYMPRLYGLLPSSMRCSLLIARYLQSADHRGSCDCTRYNTGVAHLAYERRILPYNIFHRPTARHPRRSDGDGKGNGEGDLCSPHIITFLLGWYRLGAFALPAGGFDARSRDILAAVPGLPPTPALAAWLSSYLATLQDVLTTGGLAAPLVRHVAFYLG